MSDQTQTQEPEITEDDHGAFTLEGHEPESADPAPAGREPAAGQQQDDQEPPSVEALQARLAEIEKERDHWRGASSANWNKFKEVREALALFQQQAQHQAPPGQQPDEQEVEYDESNPVPYLRYKIERQEQGIRELQNLLQQRWQAEEQQRAAEQIQRVDAHGASLLTQALAQDADFKAAFEYVNKRAFELHKENAPTFEEAFARVNEHNMRWIRQEIMAGRNPIERYKQHAQTIGWTAPPAAQQPPGGNGNGRPKIPGQRPAADPFRRPQTPRASGTQGSPKLAELKSEEDFFAAMDSGRLTDAEVAKQLAIVMPRVE